MKVAIYSRKSKLTEKGESIENQITLCEDYIITNLGINNEVIIYEDEGYSGGNTDRPQFKKMIEDVKNRKLDKVICYRLDRISRNIANFSSLIDIFSKYNVGFISIKEQFDTTTPMGRAMMYIASVFAQLERETIAERIRDNLLALSHTGRYLGWKPPYGYTKKQIEYVDKNGNLKKYNKIEELPEESQLIKMFFEKYLQWQSIKKIETYCMQNSIKTKKGHYYKCISIRRILTHPMYVIADEQIYNYMKSIGANVVDTVDKYDSEHGIIVFRVSKATQNKNSDETSIDNYSEWVVTIGEHKGLISSNDWIKTQEIIQARKSLTIRRPIGKIALLSGLLRCSNCNNYMRPFSIDKQSGRFYYICVTKESSKKALCSMKNIRGDKLDAQIIEDLKLKLLNIDKLINEVVNNKIHTKNKAYELQYETNVLNKELAENEKAIQNLIIKMSNNTNQTIEKYILEHIEKLDARNKEINNELSLLPQKKEEDSITLNNIDIFLNNIEKFNNLDNIDDFSTRKNLLASILKAIYWDGEKIRLEFLLSL